MDPPDRNSPNRGRRRDSTQNTSMSPNGRPVQVYAPLPVPQLGNGPVPLVVHSQYPNSTNNQGSGEFVQNTTPGHNGGPGQQGNSGLVGSAAQRAQRGFDGCLPGSQPQVLSHQVRSQPVLDPRAAPFQPPQNQQYTPQPTQLAYHPHQNELFGHVSPPAVPPPAFPSFQPGPNVQSQNNVAGHQQNPHPHNFGGIFPHQGPMYGYAGVNNGYGQPQGANPVNTLPNYQMPPLGNGANRQDTYPSNAIPTSGPPASSGITSYEFDYVRYPYAPPPPAAVQMRHYPQQRQNTRGRAHRRPQTNGWGPNRGLRLHDHPGRWPVPGPYPYQHPTVPHFNTSQGPGLSGPSVPTPDEPIISSIEQGTPQPCPGAPEPGQPDDTIMQEPENSSMNIPEPSEPGSSIQQEVTQPGPSAPGFSLPDRTIPQEPHQPRPSTPGPSQPPDQAPEANGDSVEADPAQVLRPGELELIRARFLNYLRDHLALELMADYTFYNGGGLDDVIVKYFRDRNSGQQPGTSNQGNAPGPLTPSQLASLQGEFSGEEILLYFELYVKCETQVQEQEP